MDPEPPPSLPNPGAANGFRSCNSTANLFLGSARKSWMATMNNASSHSRQSALSSSRSVRQPNHTDGPSSSVIATATQSAGTIASVESASDSALMSPVTPGGTIPHHNPESSLPIASPAAQGPSPAPPRSLPSPALSSHNVSPASIPAKSAKELSYTAPQASPRASTARVQLRTPEELPAAEPSTVNNSAVVAPAPSPSQPSSDAAPLSSQLSLDTLAHQCEVPIDGRFWSGLLTRLDSFLHTPSIARSLSDKGDWPRGRLLRDACSDQDLLYLAFHQIYCLHTTDPSKVEALGFTPASIQGLKVIQELLMPNRTLSPAFLDFSVNFPFDSQAMRHSGYACALRQVSQCLTRFSERWEDFNEKVRRRGYPPLIDEVIYDFHVNSSVLLTVIFLSMCRRIYGPVNEAPLHRIFLQDRKNYQRRFLQPPISPKEMQQASDKVVQQYLLIRAQLAASCGSPVGIQNTGPLETRRPVHYNSQANHAAPTRVMTSLPRGPVPSQTHHPVQTVARPGAPVPTQLPPIQTLQARAPLARQTHLTPVATAYPSEMTTPPAPRAPMGPARNPRQSAQHHTSVERRSANGRGPQQSPTMPVGPRSQAARPQTRQPQAARYPLFLPPPDHVPPNMVRPNPLRLALHQAHLRDPIKKLIHRDPGGDREVELFQYLSSFAVPPTPLGQTECAFNWKFALSSADTRRFPHRIETSPGRRALRVFTEGCRVYHLRCVKVSSPVKEVDQREWSVTDTAWPSVIYIFVNGVEQYVRRKVHHGKDLPLDITASLKEGENEISFHFLRSAAESRDTLYALAVEVMNISNFDQVRQLVGFVPAADTSSRIQKQLSSSGADDELSIVNDDIAVDLLDPFTARIFDTPVRGSVCRHLECFDLKTFLATRASKSGKGPMEWDWRCPICREDARPQTLVVDAYLDGVRTRLMQNNQLEDAKGIRIKADGSWELQTKQDTQTPEREKGRDRTPGAIPPKRKRDDSESSPLGERPPQRLKIDDSSRSERSAPQTAEVIELE